MKFLCAVITLLFSLFFNVAAQTPAATVPDFTLYKFDQTAFTKKDLAAGKPIFFVFFDTECDHCQRAVQYMNMHHRELDKASVYLISMHTKQAVDTFLKRFGSNLIHKKNVQLLHDVKNEFILRFGPKKYPSMFLYTSKKELVLYDDNEKNVYKFLKLIPATK